MKSEGISVSICILLASVLLILDQVNELLVYWWGVQSHPDWVLPLFIANVQARISTNSSMIGLCAVLTVICVMSWNGRQKIVMSSKLDQHFLLLAPLHDLLPVFAAVFSGVTGALLVQRTLSILAFCVALSGHLVRGEQIFQTCRDNSQISEAALLGTQSGRIIDGTASQEVVEDWKIFVANRYG